MRKVRVQGSSRKTRFSNVKKSSETKSIRFIGISLSGGKSDKACVATLEYFPDQKKMFLVRVIEKIKAEESISADLKIHELLHQYGSNIESIAFDVPLTLPKCLTCNLKCPGYETCDVEEIEFIRSLYQSQHDKKKPKKMYTPYTQRALESYLAHLEPNFDFQHALGANLAPMTARAHFISRRLKIPQIEVQTKLSVWRIGNQLKINKSNLKIYRNSVGGETSRGLLLDGFESKLNVFFYEQDKKMLKDNFHAFEAFICSYVGFLRYRNETQPRPKDFPSKEIWAEIPKA